MTEISSFDLPRNLIGFVCDPVSEQVINNVIKTMELDCSEVFSGTSTDAIEFLQNNRTPKILIVDISNTELPLGDITKIKERSAPDINIIAIGSRNDVGLFRDFMTMGVSDYLVKPLNNNLLLHSLKIASGAIGEYEKTGKIIQIVSSVGGAGATTITANIGWILANRHFKRTAMLDMDFLYGALGLILDLKEENFYIDILKSPDKIDDYSLETILKRCDQRLYYLGGATGLFKKVDINLTAFEALIDSIKKQFNYLLIDMQRNIDEVNEMITDKADSFVVMVEMSVASARNTARLLELLSREQPQKKVLIVANKVGLSSGGALAKKTFERVIDRKIDYQIPLDEKVVLAAANIGQPLVISNSSLTGILENIANDITGKIKDLELAREKKNDNDNGWNMNKVKNLIPHTFNKFVSLFE
ncbi:MAG: AAA family ATPase [Holosporaceae bacterium]|jgi:pilus assembly protein CpaE|nr:AAA family ATPase [Holosporaceae bacterium]